MSEVDVSGAAEALNQLLSAAYESMMVTRRMKSAPGSVVLGSHKGLIFGGLYFHERRVFPKVRPCKTEP